MNQYIAFDENLQTIPFDVTIQSNAAIPPFHIQFVADAFPFLHIQAVGFTDFPFHIQATGIARVNRVLKRQDEEDE